MGFQREVLVSVIMPAYHCLPFIDGAIESVLAQDVPLELIVIDDCSGEPLKEHMEKYRQDPRIVFVQNEKNMGAAASRNRGVSLARGKYTAFLDADDIWRPNKLIRQLERMESEGTVICSTARELMQPDGTLSGYVIPVKESFSYGDVCRQNILNCSSVVLLTEVAKAFPMHHDDAHEDYLMWLEILRKYRRGCAVNEPLLLYRVSSSGKSGSKLHSATMTFKTYKYMGFGLFRSCFYFVCYIFGGIKKYFRWFVK